MNNNNGSPNNSPPAMNLRPRCECENLDIRNLPRPRPLAVRRPVWPRPPILTLRPMPLLHRFTGQGGFFYYPEMVAGPSVVVVGGSSGGVADGGSGGPPSPAAGSKKRALEDEDEPQSCPVCGKEFAWDRAVYGHMNVHRDMEWQGSNVQEQGAGDRRTDAERLAEELAVATVEGRRGIRIDLNVDLTEDVAAPDA